MTNKCIVCKFFVLFLITPVFIAFNSTFDGTAIFNILFFSFYLEISIVFVQRLSISAKKILCRFCSHRHSMNRSFRERVITFKWLHCILKIVLIISMSDEWYSSVEVEVFEPCHLIIIIALNNQYKHSFYCIAQFNIIHK